MKNFKEKLVVLLLVVAMVTGSSSMDAWAATVSANLNSTNTTVTTTYSNCYASTIVYVIGYEKHPTTEHVVYYNKPKSSTIVGKVSFKHSTDAGYKFQLEYRGTKLQSKVVIAGSSVASLAVTH